MRDSTAISTDHITRGKFFDDVGTIFTFRAHKRNLQIRPEGFLLDRSLHRQSHHFEGPLTELFCLYSFEFLCSLTIEEGKEFVSIDCGGRLDCSCLTDEATGVGIETRSCLR